MPKDVQAPTKKTKASGKAAAKPKKDKNAPKKGLSSYMIFSSENRERIKAENPEAGFGEIGKLLGLAWKDLSEQEKAPYVAKAEADKERYLREQGAYDASGAGEE